MEKLTNTLEITGRATSIIDSRIGKGILLNAEYQGETYNLNNITGGFIKGVGGLIFHFQRSDGKIILDGLNTILLMTDCRGAYKATGMSSLNGGNFKGYMIGDDLEIKVNQSADEAIKNLYKPQEGKSK